MRRRTLLTACAGIAAGLAGCTGDGATGPDGDGTATDPTTDSRSPAPTPSHRVTHTEFAVTSSECGTGESRATVSRADGTVTVDGTATGNDGCYTAALRSASFEGDELRIAVVTRDEGGTDTVCVQCLVDIEYEASVDYEGEVGSVVVTHDGDVVTEVGY